MAGQWINSARGSVLSLVRVVVGLTFMSHGLQKILGLLGGKTVQYFSLVGMAGFIELIGGLLLMIGLFSRLVAFLCSGEMAVAYFMSHAPHGFWPVVNHGETAVLYCFIFFYMVFSGPGPISLDRALKRDGKN